MFFFFLFTKCCREFCNKILEYEKRATKLPKISHLVIVRWKYALLRIVTCDKSLFVFNIMILSSLSSQFEPLFLSFFISSFPMSLSSSFHPSLFLSRLTQCSFYHLSFLIASTLFPLPSSHHLSSIYLFVTSFTILLSSSCQISVFITVYYAFHLFNTLFRFSFSLLIFYLSIILLPSSYHFLFLIFR